MTRLAYSLLTALIAGAWLANGLYAKVMGQVPRHEQIVARVVGVHLAPALTVAIGLGEVALAIWILRGRRPLATAAVQIALVMTMNAIEAWLARDLLMWGWANPAFAAAFCTVVYFHGRLGAAAAT